MPSNDSDNTDIAYVSPNWQFTISKKAINTSQLKNRQSNSQTTQSNQVQVKTG